MASKAVQGVFSNTRKKDDPETMSTPEIRLLQPSDSIEALTHLVHRAYKRLADMGLTYMATSQPCDVTAARVAQGECYVALEQGVIVGTVVFKPAASTRGSPWLDLPGVCGLAQFAVDPDSQSRGLGTLLMDKVEARAEETGAAEIALDTAEPARHLVQWYGRRGYRVIEYAQWGHTNYRSVIMSKPVSDASAHL